MKKIWILVSLFAIAAMAISAFASMPAQAAPRGGGPGGHDDDKCPKGQTETYTWVCGWEGFGRNRQWKCHKVLTCTVPPAAGPVCTDPKAIGIGPDGSCEFKAPDWNTCQSVRNASCYRHWFITGGESLSEQASLEAAYYGRSVIMHAQ